MRGLNALTAVVLLLAGGVGSFFTWANTDPELWAPNGWWLLAAIGVGLAFVDLVLEERAWARRNQEAIENLYAALEASRGAS
jgi:hypothetical protein